VPEKEPDISGIVISFSGRIVVLGDRCVKQVH